MSQEGGSISLLCRPSPLIRLNIQRKKKGSGRCRRSPLAPLAVYATCPMAARRTSAATSATPTDLTAKRAMAQAPSVWIAADWATHPIIEHFYGHAAPRARVNSFDEVMSSPTNLAHTTTLAATFCSYADEELDQHPQQQHDEPLDNTRRRLNGSGLAMDVARLQRRSSLMIDDPRLHQRERGSYSYSTDTSDENEAILHPFDAMTTHGVHESAIAAPQRKHRRPSLEIDDVVVDIMPLPACVGSGFAAWNRIRRTVDNEGQDLVPVPNVSGATGVMAIKNRSTFVLPSHLMENPQGGGSTTSSMGWSPTASLPTSPDSVGHAPGSRLRSKLLECAIQVDDRIQRERQLADNAKRRLKKSPAPAPPTGVMWNLLCGARTGDISQFDGVTFLHDRLSVATHNRALNQLQRHRRHVNGILQIVSCHNPDLELTEKQLDSFESANAMLANDIKYTLLCKQVEMLAARKMQRDAALQHAKQKNGTDCFEMSRAKCSMMAKLLEAVSWYRLVQINTREESASSSVTAPVDTADHLIVAGLDGSETPMPRSSATRSLQEFQVEKILNVLAGEEFYSDYNELMCSADWWEIAQAHFENLIFSKGESRICQLIERISKDVAMESYEELEQDGYFNDNALDSSSKKGDRSPGTKRISAYQFLHHQADWTKNPQPEQIMEFIDRLTRRIRHEFDVPNNVSKSLHSFIQRTVFPRVSVLCFNQKAIRDCQRKDKIWRKKCVELRGISMENLNVPIELAVKIRSRLSSRRVRSGHDQRVYFIRAIEAFNGMDNIVPCDLLDELMHGVIILHHEAALVLGTTQFSVETFFPLLAYVLLHCSLPRIHAQLHLLENFAITTSNVNGEESYYVYCVHAAVEYICNSAGLAPSGFKGSESKVPAPPETPESEATISSPSPTELTAVLSA